MDNVNVLFLLLMIACGIIIGLVGYIAYLHEMRVILEERFARNKKNYERIATQLANAKRFIWETDLLRSYKEWYLKPSLLEDSDVVPWKDPLDPALVEKISQAFKVAKEKAEDAEVEIITLPDRSQPIPALAPAPAAQLKPFGFVPRA